MLSRRSSVILYPGHGMSQRSVPASWFSRTIGFTARASVAAVAPTGSHTAATTITNTVATPLRFTRAGYTLLGFPVVHPEGGPAMADAAATSDVTTITEHEAEQVDRANEAGVTPVVFVHGLWLLPSSWDRWAKVFEDAGYIALTPGWPDDPETVEEANAAPEALAGKSVGEVADHFDAGHPRARREAGHRRSLVRRIADPDPRRTRVSRPRRSRSTPRRSVACCPCRSRR